MQVFPAGLIAKNVVRSEHIVIKNKSRTFKMVFSHPNTLRDILEEWDGVPRRGASSRAEHAMARCLRKALRRSLKPFTDVDDEGIWDRGRVNPLTRQVLNLKAGVRGGYNLGRLGLVESRLRAHPTCSGKIRRPRFGERFVCHSVRQSMSLLYPLIIELGVEGPLDDPLGIAMGQSSLATTHASV